jgi:hypothetical protein
VVEAEAEASRRNRGEPQQGTFDLRGQRFWVAVDSRNGAWHEEAQRDKGSVRGAIGEFFNDLLP